jgi:hypothetical protein
MRRSLSGLCRFGGRLVLAAGLCLLLASLVDGTHWLLSANQKQSAGKSKKKGKKKGQPVEEAPPPAAVEMAKDPKPPKDDFTVQVYKKMDEAKLETASFKDQFEIDQVSQNVEVVITYYNWAISNKDYWNRQINIDTKSPSGAVIEHITKSGFGDLGYVPEGKPVTSDVYRKEQVVVRGDVATSRMVDAEIGPDERDRFKYLLTKFILEK